MKIKIKKLHLDAVLPSYAKNGDAGMDLTAVSKTRDEYDNIVYGTGIAIEIPEGYFGLVVPRSSNSKKNLILSNHCGIIDSGYRGEITFKYSFGSIHNVAKEPSYNIGDRIGQLIIQQHPYIEFTVVDELSDTERGVSGYGSTGM